MPASNMRNWCAFAIVVIVAALAYVGIVLAHAANSAEHDYRRTTAARAARLADAYYTQPPCIHIRDLPLRKAYTQADIDRLCINRLPRRAP